MLTAARTALPGTLMLCMCLFCLAYYGLCVRRAGPRVSGLWIWPAGGFLFGGASLLSYLCPAWFGRSWDFLLQHPALKSAVLTACAAALLLFLLLELMIFSGMFKKGRKGLPYIIVLGAKVKGSLPSRALRERLDTAYSYLRANPGTSAILSGGRGPDEAVSEALCMYEYLTARGISPARLILEDCSASTRENLRFSLRLLPASDVPVGILTHNYHVRRACLIARKNGIKNTAGIAAPSGSILQLHYLIRETAALLREIISRS